MTGDPSRRPSRSRLDQWLNAELDGELDSRGRTELESAPEDLTDDRAALRALDGGLRHALAPNRPRAEFVSDRIVRRLESESPSWARERRGSTVRWTPAFALGTAAGFVLALCLFGPAYLGNRKVASDPSGKAADPNAQLGEAGVAIVLRSRGTVDLGSSTGKGSEPLAAEQSVPLGSRITTRSDGLCEFEFRDGTRVALDRSSEVVLRSDGTLAFARGAIAATSPASKGAQTTLAIEIDGGTVELRRGTGSGVEIRETGDGPRILALSGDVTVLAHSLKAKSRSASLAAGEAILVDDRIGLSSTEGVDPLLASNWLLPLLETAELVPRLERLITSARRSKQPVDVSAMIRPLGALGGKLLAAITVKSQQLDPIERRDAARLASELASASAIPALLDFLSNDDEEVRAAGQRALIRLTGQRFGGSPENWAASGAKSTKLRELHIDEWHRWWRENEHRYDIE